MTDTHTIAHIPDEAVQAREKIEKIAKYFINEGSRDYTQEICYALKNVGLELLDALNDIPHLSSPCAVEVKKLEWTERYTSDGRKQWNSSDREVITETCHEWDTPQGFRLFFLMATYPTIEEAKAAAQADFERRVRECVVTKPVNIPALLQEVRSGERDGFINTGQEPHGNDADLSCPCCGGSGHKDDANPVDALTASEAVYGLLAWLTSRNETVVLGSRHGAAIGAELADAFCKENNLGNCRDNYHEYLNHPSITISQPVDVATVRRQAFEEGFENGVEQSLNALDAYDDITRNEAEQGIRELKPDYRALSAEPAQGEQWQPIETAPKDGTFILAINAKDNPNRQHIVHYSERHSKKYPWVTDSAPMSWVAGLTHWMPLPAAPNSEAGK